MIIIQVHSNGSKGDTADSFAFATLFPNVLQVSFMECWRMYLSFYLCFQPGVSVLSNTLFAILVKCKVCKKQVRRYDVGAPSGITISLPGAESQDAERRRQIALRALSERLSKTEPAASQQWPSLDEPDKTGDSPSPGPGDTASVVSTVSSVASVVDNDKEADTPEVLVQI